MTGAEQQHRRRIFPVSFDPPVFRFISGVGRGDFAGETAVVADPGARGERPHRLGCGQFQDLWQVGSGKCLDGEIDPAAAALAKLRPEREALAQFRPAPLGQRGAGASDRLIFQRAAPDGALERGRRSHDHARARLARGRAFGADDRDKRRRSLFPDRRRQTFKNLQPLKAPAASPYLRRLG